MLKSREQLSSGSQAGSIGRLADVSSEAGPSTRVNRPIDEAFPPQGGMPPPTAAAPAPDPFAILYNDVTSRLQSADQTTGFSGVFSPAAAAAAPSSSLDELFQMSAACDSQHPQDPCRGDTTARWVAPRKRFPCGGDSTAGWVPPGGTAIPP